MSIGLGERVLDAGTKDGRQLCREVPESVADVLRVNYSESKGLVLRKSS